MSAVMETINVSKTYTMGALNVEVLKNVNLAINKGEFVSIMGPSGSGKSTLLYLMGGLDHPTEGEVKLNGRGITGLKDKQESLMRRREIGFVFQFYNLIPNLNLEDNVMLPVLLDGKSLKAYRERVSEILALVGLSDRRKHTPRELSGGEQQRVAIARALINEPDIILADEPIGNLDSKTGMGIMTLFQQINADQNKTIVQVTHSKDAAAYGERVVQVKDGKVWN